MEDSQPSTCNHLGEFLQMDYVLKLAANIFHKHMKLLNTYVFAPVYIKNF